MKKIKLLIEYDGTAYHGWQVQKDEKTVQGVMEDRVARITGLQSSIVGASRTDAGVHALRQVAAFRTKSGLDGETIKRALNANLPDDIRVLEAVEIEDSFHPRKDAIQKTYVYFIANQKTSPVFFCRYSWLVPQRLSIDSMADASRALVGEHDFSAFMGAGSDIKDSVREIYSLHVERLESIDFMTASLKGNFMKIIVGANGFLRHMVRNIVGTLVEVGRGRISPDKMKEILVSRDRKRAGQTAPARGLFLERIVY